MSVIAMPAIEIREVHKRFTLPRSADAILRHPFARKRLEVLRGLSLSVPLGSTTGLLGPNGAGKTTLLRILAATVTPDQGTVTILGQDAVKHPGRIRQQLGFVLSDERSFFWRLTARHNLSFFATLANLAPKKIKARVNEVAALLQIESELDKPFRDLSTGMRQRLSLARTLLHDPEVLLIDEPTRAMDPGAAQRTRKLLGRTLVEEMGKTVLLATHNLDEAQELCERVALLREGRIQIEGATAAALPEIAKVFAEDQE